MGGYRGGGKSKKEWEGEGRIPMPVKLYQEK